MRKWHWVVLLGVAACSGDGSGATRFGNSAGGGSGSSGGGAPSGSSSDPSGGTAAPGDIGVAKPTMGGALADAACTQVSQEAEKRLGGNADIIVAVDNSLSMSEEAAAVQSNLNAFSSQIEAS